MADATIANLTDGVTAVSTDRIPVERSPFGAGQNRYITPGYLVTLVDAPGEAAAAVATHEAAVNPHPTYLTQAEGDAAYEALGAVATHAAAGDPHPAYALESALGTMSTQNASGVAITGGSASGLDLTLKDETVASNGDFAFNRTTEELNYHNGQRALTDAVGWTPHATAIFSNGAGGNTYNLAVESAGLGGALAIPVLVHGHMLFETLTIRQAAAASARSAEWRLYRQRLNNGNSGENTLDEVSGANGTFSFTPTAGSNESSSVGSPPVYLAPGCYWLVIRNTSTTQAFPVAGGAGPLLAPTLGQTKAIAALGSTIDMVAATWTANLTVPNIILKGRVFGQTTVF